MSWRFDTLQCTTSTETRAALQLQGGLDITRPSRRRRAARVRTIASYMALGVTVCV